jgi:serine/threonine protein kinase
MESETATEGSWSYEGESVQVYGQTISIGQTEETESLQGKPVEPEGKQVQPNTTWKYHDLESSLLEFLAFLADHNVPVVKLQDVTLDEAEFGRGTTMRVCSGRLHGQAMAIKYPGQDVFKTGYTIEEPTILKDQFRSFEKLLKTLMFEIQIMRHPQLRKHPNIVELEAVAFEDGLVAAELCDVHSQLGEKAMTQEVFFPVLILEPAIKAHTDLSKFFKVHAGVRIPSEVAASIISDIALGLAALHALGIVHGDVKDENILLFQEAVDGTTRIVAKVADFGTAGIDTMREDIRGLSRYWAAPEVMERPPGWEGLRRTPAADIYSFGILAATIALNGKRVFDGVDPYTMKMGDMAAKHIKVLLDKVFENRQNDNTTGDLITFVDSTKQLVDQAVVRDPKKRLRNLSKIPDIFGKM